MPRIKFIAEVYVAKHTNITTVHFILNRNYFQKVIKITGKACLYQTLYLTDPIHKLR
jgi:hypothetical protein